MKKLNIVVIMGGISTEREISLSGGAIVVENIDTTKYNVYELIVDEPMDVVNKMPDDVDFALIILHGKFGEDGTIQAMLEAMNIKYSGCDVLTSALCMNKNMTKKILKSASIPTAKWIHIKNGDVINYDAIDTIGYPVIVKPCNGGPSVATFKVDKKEDIADALNKALSVDESILVEEYLDGEEYTSFIVDGEVLPTIKITSQAGFFDYESKYSDDENIAAKEEVVQLDDALQKQLNDTSIACWNAFNCRGYVRVDFILHNGIFYTLELNTLPGMSQASLIPKSAKPCGINYTQLIDRLIESSL